jgi:HIP---CoA ligase
VQGPQQQFLVAQRELADGAALEHRLGRLQRVGVLESVLLEGDRGELVGEALGRRLGGDDIAATVGTPCEGFELRIAGDGELLVRGYAVMRGYLDDPAATEEAIDPDGWLHTGDLGTLDERGHLKIVGRKKDIFIVGGFNAYPAEIEGFLMEHPAVAQAAVIGVPDERMGQVGKAFVVARSAVTADELIAWSKTRMAGFKVPRYVAFLDALPLNATGKVMKDQLT